MGKVYPPPKKNILCIYIYIYIHMYNTSFYHTSFVRPFIIFKETHPSSVLPFRYSILGVNPPRPLRPVRCEVVVTCQMIVTSHGGSPDVLHVKRRGNHRGKYIFYRFLADFAAGQWCSCIVPIHDLNMMVITSRLLMWFSGSKRLVVILHFVVLIAGFCMILLHSQQEIV